MSDYKIGGWTQQWDQAVDTKFKSFSYFMFGMITNLTELKSGVKGGWGWSPSAAPVADGVAKVSPPSTPGDGTCLWTYGGAGCAPTGMPTTDAEFKAIVDTQAQNWKGVDFDDECDMCVTSTGGIVGAMKALKTASLETSYTFLAGADYVDSSQTKVKEIAKAGCCDRFCMMCYGGSMWDPGTIKQYVPAAVKATLAAVPDSKKVFLALTPAGLDDTNLKFFLDQVKNNNLGGLFVWDFETLTDTYLEKICSALGIS